MSVPTTYTGKHEGCGGQVVFRPVAYRRDLLAGRTVTLRAVCRQCGTPISVAYSLAGVPSASMAREVHAGHVATSPDRADVVVIAEPMPMAAGAEGLDAWALGEQQQSTHAASGGGHAETTHGDESHGTVTALAEWQNRASRGNAGTRLRRVEPFEGQTDDDQHRQQEKPTAPFTAGAPATSRLGTARTSADRESAYMQQFAQRFAAAREAVRRVREELPDVLTTDAGGWSTPTFAPPLTPTAAPAPTADPQAALAEITTPEVPTPEIAAPLIAAPVFAAPEIPAPAVDPQAEPEVATPLAAAEPPVTGYYDAAAVAVESLPAAMDEPPTMPFSPPSSPTFDQQFQQGSAASPDGTIHDAPPAAPIASMAPASPPQVPVSEWADVPASAPVLADVLTSVPTVDSATDQVPMPATVSTDPWAQPPSGDALAEAFTQPAGVPPVIAPAAYGSDHAPAVSPIAPDPHAAWAEQQQHTQVDVATAAAAGIAQVPTEHAVLAPEADEARGFDWGGGFDESKRRRGIRRKAGEPEEPHLPSSSFVEDPELSGSTSSRAKLAQWVLLGLAIVVVGFFSYSIAAKVLEPDTGSSAVPKQSTPANSPALAGGAPASEGAPPTSAGEPSTSAGEPSTSAGEPSISAGEPSTSESEPADDAGSAAPPNASTASATAGGTNGEKKTLNESEPPADTTPAAQGAGPFTPA